ncbi:MAG: EamA family transporter [Saprospiraceae bacterium]|nr:EamA family transporter [Saprospiraceae bacterium]MBK8820284.1 EamA family transporter [Saprospiraceae bacterium]MBK8853280.1 EamA family transporter [Saprospiraceae bacterium]MBK9042122.1 EamA family transporter [Saprospiraceae bacterium]
MRQKGTYFKALLALAVVSLVWGTTWVVSKVGVGFLPGLQLASIRQIIAGTAFLVYFFVKKYTLPERSDYLPLIILAILNFVMSNGLSTWGVMYIPAGLGSIIGAIFPFWIVILGFIGENTKPPARSLAGLVIGFSGICIIFYDHVLDFVKPDFRFGIFLSLFSTFTWALGTLYTKKHAKRFNPYFGLGFQLTISGIILFIISLYNPGTLSLVEIPWQAWVSIIYLVVFGSMIGFIAYIYALQHLPTEQTAIYAYINPIVAIITGSIFLHEKTGLFILAGVITTLTGVYLVNSSYRSK